MNENTFEKQIKRIFERDTLPVHVPNIDIVIDDSEIIYTATHKFKVGPINNENWDFDSVDKPRYIYKEGVKTIEFVIRKGLIYIISLKNSII